LSAGRGAAGGDIAYDARVTWRRNVAVGAAAGFVATLCMDIVGGGLLRSTGLTAGVHPRFLGRWFAGILHGQLVHENILAAPPVDKEFLLAIPVHNAIGITLGIAYVLALSWLSLKRGSVWTALGFGLLTNALPWFVMYPAMGFGVLGLAGPPELMLLRTSFVNHLIYGLGLGVWLTVLAPRIFKGRLA
jgi:hypothetical protein